MGKIIVVVGGQFGSEGKGAVAGYLAKGEENLLAIRVGGPNAGHTVYGVCRGPDDLGKSGNPNGCEAHDPTELHRYPLRQVPVAAVTNPTAKLAIAEGSEIDPPVLAQEVEQLGCADRLMIDAQATIIEKIHKDREQGMAERLGSTQKGIGAARAERIMRRAEIVNFYHGDTLPGSIGRVANVAESHLQQGGTVMIEGTQGYGLGLHAGYYPYCTSIDCRAIDMLALAGVNPWGRGIQIWVVIRAYPIRVAGDSGPLYRETSWEKLGLSEERTTVTQKVRRVGEPDIELAGRAIWANGGPNNVKIAFTMFDHLNRAAAGQTNLSPYQDQLRNIEDSLGARIELVGTGPQTIVDIRKPYNA